MTKRKTHDEFLVEFNNLSNGEYELLSEYQTTHKKVKVKHIACGHLYEVAPSKFLIGRRCPNCKNERIGKSNSKSHEHFLKRFNAARNDLEVMEKYRGTKVKITFKHKECGKKFKATPGNVIGRKSGCPHCYGHKNSDVFKEHCATLYGDDYSVIGEYTNNRIKVMVKHNKCGHEWKVIPKDFLNGHGCPLCQTSKGEEYIRAWLNDKGIKFTEQHRFKDCRYKLPLPFDFAVDTDEGIHLIEFDGEQHFGRRNYWGRENAREEIKRNDRIKDEYCKANSIPLLRIPYWYLRTDRINRELESFLQLTKGSTTSL